MNDKACDPTSFIRLSEWLQWLEHTRPEHDMDLSIERVKQVGEQCQLLTPAPFVITVAGTNGKGSTVTLMESILRQEGYKTGLYTSPHLFHFCERIQISGTEVEETLLTEAFSYVNQQRGDIWLSYFEFAVLVAAYCFRQSDIDIAILEVGLGGRLDATNIIEPDIAVITTVSLDHQDRLGNTIEEIAREKAGILRAGKPAIYGSYPVPESVLQYAESLKTTLHCRDKEFGLEETENGWCWRGLSNSGKPLLLQNLPTPSLVIDNAATVLQALQFLPEVPNQEVIAKGIRQVRLKGRCQQERVVNHQGHDIEIILDVGHNPQAVSYFTRKLATLPKPVGKTTAIVAMYDNKDCEGIIIELKEAVDEWLVTEFDSPRAFNKEALKAVVTRHSAHAELANSVETAYSQSLDNAQPGDRIVVTGSFVTVASVLAMLNQGH